MASQGWEKHLFSHLLPSQSEMAAIDAATISSGIDSAELMRRAGKAVFQTLREKVSRQLNEGLLLILCGPGNNGGDGFVIAQEALKADLSPLCIVVAAEHYSDECREQLRLAAELGVPLLSLEPLKETSLLGIEPCSEERLAALKGNASVLVDALLGTGQREAPRGGVALILEQIELLELECPKVAVDMPTGVNGDTGQVFTPHFESDITIVIELTKRGMLQYPARLLVGELVRVSIGLSEGLGSEFSLLSTETVPRLSARPPNSHKGLFGKVAVCGGSREMPGAPALTAEAAVAAGSGVVLLAQPYEAALRCAAVEHEIMRWCTPINTDKELNEAAVEEFLLSTEAYDILVLGPGMGNTLETQSFMKAIVSEWKGKLLHDADALNALSSLLDAGQLHWSDLKNTILTPHPGEAARLLGVSTRDVQEDRYSAARELAKKSSAVVVLKGASTVVYHQEGGWVCPHGTPYLATAGSGDVLAGFIAAFWAQGHCAAKAACAGVYLHARAGERLEELTRVPFKAGSLGDVIGSLWSEVVEGVN